MKNKFGFILGTCMLISNVGISQSPLEKERLKIQAEKFITLYNTGDTLRYREFLGDIIENRSALENTLARFMNTYNTIGKVDLRKIRYPSPTQTEIIVQEPKFESWWKFTVMTDEKQNFLSRTVLPIPLPLIGLKSKKISNRELKTELDGYITNKLGDGFSGNVYIAKHGNSLYNRSFGKNPEGKPNTKNTEFGLASAGKMFTAIAILQLHDRKKLDLENRVVKFLPNLKNKNLYDITLAQLLTHTSGMGDFFESPLYEKLKDSLNTSDSFLAFIEADEPQFAPGSNLRYSNTGFSLLGLIIEKVGGQPFQEYVREHIFDPLSMEHTQAGTGAGGGTSTIDDMAKFLTGLNKGGLLGPETRKTLFTYTVDGHYGYGTEHHAIGSEHIVGHSGGFINECVELNLYPNTDHIVVILSNSNPPFGHFLSNKIKGLLIQKQDTLKLR